MDRKQAVWLYNGLSLGRAIGLDSDGDTVHERTEFAAIAGFHGKPTCLSQGNNPALHKLAADFLREIADALESKNG